MEESPAAVPRKAETASIANSTTRPAAIAIEKAFCVTILYFCIAPSLTHRSEFGQA